MGVKIAVWAIFGSFQTVKISLFSLLRRALLAEQLIYFILLLSIGLISRTAKETHEIVCHLVSLQIDKIFLASGTVRARTQTGAILAEQPSGLALPNNSLSSSRRNSGE